ncbi:MAG: AAA family ATPase [Nanoarchaeota archaeon]|nr:AAA family ATPase [Nanoarchaeota archaeon]
MKNVVYFSGSHGSGKSTLIEKLAEKEPELFLAYSKLVLPEKFQDIHNRNKVRLARYYLHASYLNELAKEKPNKIILCDRCSHDNLAYIKGFENIGWLSKENLENYLRMHNFLITEELKPENVIFLNPPLEEVINNIKKRWAETGKKKWREDDFNYLVAIRKGFEKVYSEAGANILEIRYMDLEKRVKESLDWIKNLEKY